MIRFIWNNALTKRKRRWLDSPNPVFCFTASVPAGFGSRSTTPELVEEASATSSRMAAGNQVGELARKLYPGGVLIEGDNLAQALDDTVCILAGELCQQIWC